MRMNDDATLSLRGSESNLRELLFDQPSSIEAGFRPREREHETPADPVDVWGYDDDGQPVVLELKCRRSGSDPVSQRDDSSKSCPNRPRSDVVNRKMAPSRFRFVRILHEIGVDVYKRSAVVCRMLLVRKPNGRQGI